MAIEFVARQGDVALIRLDAAPEPGEAIPREHGRVVLAHGELTGHAHAIAEPHVTHHQLSPDARRTLARDDAAVVSLLRVIGVDAWLRHEEHAPVKLPAGDYLVVRQREYQPGALPRTVAD